MQRRRFLQVAPAATACGVLTAATEAQALTHPNRFERVSYETFYVEGAKGAFLVEHHVVTCPFETGSNMWSAISGYHDEDEAVLSWLNSEGVERNTRKMKRMIFPRHKEAPDGKVCLSGENSATPREWLLPVVERTAQVGFMQVKPKDDPDAWKIVWVEYHCTDGGIEHVITSLPMHWDSEIPLAVQVQTAIV
jgi:hypothetical protein